MTANMMHLLRLTFRFQLSSGKDRSVCRLSRQVESAMRVPKTQSADAVLVKTEREYSAGCGRNLSSSPTRRPPQKHGRGADCQTITNERTPQAYFQYQSNDCLQLS